MKDWKVLIEFHQIKSENQINYHYELSIGKSIYFLITKIKLMFKLDLRHLLEKEHRNKKLENNEYVIRKIDIFRINLNDTFTNMRETENI